MAKWKLTRQTFGSEEFFVSEGDEVTIGRDVSNTITLSSLVISRKHCVLKVFKDKLTVKDLKSSNGTYLNSTKIPAQKSIDVQDSQNLGLGWIDGAGITDIENNQKYIFKVSRERSLIDRIAFQNDFDHIETKLSALDNGLEERNDHLSVSSRLSLKRKIDKNESCINKTNNLESLPDIINLLSDSESEQGCNKLYDINVKKIKLEPIMEEVKEKPNIKEEPIKCEIDDDFHIKQEFFGYDDEPINVDSDSDSDTEMRWFMRLSQSSPGKPLKHSLIEDVVDAPSHESSYSQIIDDRNNCFLENNHEEFLDDLITIPENISVPSIPLDNMNNDFVDGTINKEINSDYLVDELEKVRDMSPNKLNKDYELQTDIAKVKRAQLIKPIPKSSKKKARSSSYKQTKSTNSHSKPKQQITESLKEERKKKLKEIATKDKEDIEEKEKNKSHLSSTNKVAVSAKVSSSSRGAFLTETSESVKPNKRKDTSQKSRKGHHNTSDSKNLKSSINLDITQDIENKIQNLSKTKENKDTNNKSKQKERQSSKPLKKLVNITDTGKNVEETNKPKENKECEDNVVSFSNELEANNCHVTNSLLRDTHNKYSGKPISTVVPFSTKKKTVRFSSAPPQIRIFEIEPGNQLKKTSLVKATLLDVPQKNYFSLEKITLIRILRWNVQWLKEQINNSEPPPILGHNKPPMSLLHHFQNHTQYVQVVGDLLLMEIWESVTQAYMKQRSQEYLLPMSIEYLPPMPTPEHSFDIFSLSVNVSLPKTELRRVPRMGELMLLTFGSEEARISRFFYVHNVNCLPSPANNRYCFFSVSLHGVFTEKLKVLRQGESIQGRTLCYIKNVLQLYEAMEYLSRSPLCEMILRPDPRHFDAQRHLSKAKIVSPWTVTLNESQSEAVMASVSAALGDKPGIQMIQGPPGTGKSSVICSIVMSYFYNSHGRLQQNRGKVLICATSNAAVDELVIRLLNIRQSLPKMERFRMVRVGRSEAMHPKARDVSSQHLAARDLQRAALPDALQPLSALSDEISRLEAKLNMWQSQFQDSKDPARTAYCQFRIDQIKSKISQLKGGGGGGGMEASPERLASAERRIVERADIIVSTLSSAGNHKMKEVRRKVDLCIVDEAGQAIEPDTLIPLTLDITKLTLIGDPQQLPGFIKSQRARQHGLGESLFSRLSSSMETWQEGSPVVLLNVQYRMHPHIAEYPNTAFYGGLIKNAVAIRTDHPLLPYSVLYISSGDKGQGLSGANETESWGVARLVVALSSLVRSFNMSIAVITPYEAQRESIKKNLRMLEDPNTPPVEVNTVDSFQGQERDVVVVSLARSKGVGFLNDVGRMNVMLTRAKHSLIICLNPNAMVKNPQWRTLMQNAEFRKLQKYLPNHVCQPTTAKNTDNEAILKYVTRK